MPRPTSNGSDDRPSSRPSSGPSPYRSDDPAKRARQNANLLRGISSDPETRKAQISHLTRGVTHGTRGGEQLERGREKHEQELLQDYPGLDRRRRALLADRLARIELASRWVERNGIERSRKGEVFPIVDRLETWAKRAEDLLAVAEAERQAHGGPTLEEITAEILAGSDGAAA